MASRDCIECKCGQYHKGHICWLNQMEMFAEIYHLTSNPTVLCSKCGGKANLAHNVCFPVPLVKVKYESV